jgi:two-component system, OmpR family, response regulator PrrA
MVLVDSVLTSPRVMVVADDADVLTALERGLRLSGFDMSSAKNGDEALSFVRQAPPDAVVVDINPPMLRGIDVVTALRAVDNSVPVCVLPAPSSVDDEVPWLEAGADDCLFKPFGLSELVTRLRALLRRPRPALTSSFGTITVGPLVVEIPQRRACVDGIEIEFTRREFDLLAVLAEHTSAVLSRARLLELVWGNAHFAADTYVVDAFIGNLRRKLDAARAPRLLQTVPGAGFVLRVQ